MPIDHNSYERFFRGTGAEHYISSLLYFAGYEVTKPSPDTGIDCIVTNIARTKLFEDKPKVAYLQVKSAILDRTGASFSIEKSDFEALCTKENYYSVFCLIGNINPVIDPDSLNTLHNPVDFVIDGYIADHCQELMAKNGRAIVRNGASMLNNNFVLHPFWMNSSQMKRSRDDQLWVEKDGNFYLNVSLNENQIYLNTLSLIPELLDVRYIMQPCLSEHLINTGMFSPEHL